MLMPNTPVPAERSPRVTLRFMAAPTDVLHHGALGVSGGRVLEWIDKAAYACAAQTRDYGGSGRTYAAAHSQHTNTESNHADPNA